MATASKARNVIVNASAKHTATIIFSHGLGDSAAGWHPFALELAPKFPHLKWILTNAPVQPVTINMGMSMPAWFDLKTLDPPNEGDTAGYEDHRGAQASVDFIRSIVDDEVASGIPSERIVVGGFSQGAAIALLTGIQSEKKVAGVAALSGFLLMRDRINKFKSEHALETPIFWGHGMSDPVIGIERARLGADKLNDLGFSKFEFHAYPRLPHSINGAEQAHFESWLNKVIPSS